jgi:hypothetical protein
MKNIIILLLLVSSHAFGQGLILSSPEDKASFPKLPADSFGFTESLPLSYSLEKYVPPVLSQNGGTCVGFASFYYGLSTMYNIKFNLTDPDEKYVHSFDPYFIYSIQFNDKDDCDNGLSFIDAFDKLMNIGAKKTLFPPFTNCGTKWSVDKLKNTLDYTTPYSINNYYYLDKESKTKNQVIDIVKGALYNDIPVITGFKFVESMYTYNSANISGVKSDGLWDPSANEKRDGGHALCVIGYDDTKFGGSFRIVNSWGTDYGDRGFIWVKYDDFVEYGEAIFFLELNENIKDLTPAEIEAENYTRYNYKNNSNTFSSYEGQYKNNGLNGYGIWSDKDTDTYYVGKYDDAEMTGYFLILDEDGFYSANAVNGTLQDVESFGFGSNEELMETEISAKKFFEKLGSEFSLRKANSTKTNKPKTSKQ